MNIYQRIVQCMKDCGAIGKNKFNKDQNYRFRGIDDVMNALSPAMSKNGIFVVPNVLDITREERVSAKGKTLIYTTATVEYTFFSEEGDSVKCVVVGEGMDSGDKSVNKALSAAFKYACFQTFCIPTEEMHDSEEDSPEVAPRRSAAKRTEKAAQPAPAPQAPQKAQKEMISQEDLILLQSNLMSRHDKYTVEYVQQAYKIDDLRKLTAVQARKLFEFLNIQKEVA